MFCPRCGAENKSEQKYCRQCGLSLAVTPLALTGQLDEVLGELKKGEKSIQKGATLLGVFLLVTLVTIPLSGAYSMVRLKAAKNVPSLQPNTI